MSETLVSALTMLLVWGSLLWKLQTLHWRPRDTIQRSYCGALLALALAMTVPHPPIYRAVDRIIGIPNFARLLGNGLGVISAWAFQPVITRLLRYQARGRGIFGGVWAMIGTLSAMVYLFSRMSVPQSAPLDFQQRYGAAPFGCASKLCMSIMRCSALSGRDAATDASSAHAGAAVAAPR